MLELMRVRMHRMEELIEGLLQYSRAGRLHKQPETVDVVELVREVVDLLAPPDGVTLMIAQDLPVVVTERLLLQQVFHEPDRERHQARQSRRSHHRGRRQARRALLRVLGRRQRRRHRARVPRPHLGHLPDARGARPRGGGRDRPRAASRRSSSVSRGARGWSRRRAPARPSASCGGNNGRAHERKSL